MRVENLGILIFKNKREQNKNQTKNCKVATAARHNKCDVSNMEPRDTCQADDAVAYKQSQDSHENPLSFKSVFLIPL